MSLALFTEMTPPPNEAGGLANAIFGSLVMVAWPPSSARRSA
jgi:phosphate transport system permease protein